MREIKFRAWDKHNKKWITEPVGFTMSVADGKFHIFGFDDAFADMYQERIKLQQSTGLFDKNNVEIYEKDVLKVSKDVGWINAVVVFKAGAFVVSSPLLNVVANVGDMIDTAAVEVIGNIYETPELVC